MILYLKFFTLCSFTVHFKVGAGRPEEEQLSITRVGDDPSWYWLVSVAFDGGTKNKLNKINDFIIS